MDPSAPASILAALENDMKDTKSNGDKQPPPPPPATTGEEEILPVASKKVKRKHMDPAVLEVRKTIQGCCATNNLVKAMETYNQAVQQQTRIEPQTFYNLLNLCDGLGDRGLHIGTPRSKEKNQKDQDESLQKPPFKEEKDSEAEEKRKITTDTDEKASAQIEDVGLETRLRYAQRIQGHMQALSIPLVENAYTALLKLYSKSKMLDEAEKLLTEAEQVQQCKTKLRLYTPLLVAYCEMGRMVEALSVWKRIVAKELAPGEREYNALMQCATRVGDAAVMERVLSDLSEDVLVPSREIGKTIVQWFQSAHAVRAEEATKAANSDDSLARSQSQQLLNEIRVPHADPSAVSLGPVQCDKPEMDGWTVDIGCPVDPSTGRLKTGCLAGECLQPVKVSEPLWQEMIKMNETIVLSGKLDKDASQFQGGRKGRKRQVGSSVLDERKRHWNEFQKDLDRRCRHRKIDFVLDGANIGFFEQNFAGAPTHVDYNQIDWVVDYLAEKKLSVLLIMHSRHFAPNMIPRQFEPLMRKWLNMGVLYRTPPGMNDDWFWLHAALKSGPGTLVLSNDEMRDHHFQMMAPRSFLRWKDRHLVRFRFGGWRKGSGGSGSGSSRRLVELSYPERYSRRIQRVENGLVIPLPKRGDENRFLDGSFVANDDEPIEETYLCIRSRKAAKMSGDNGNNVESVSS